MSKVIEDPSSRRRQWVWSCRGGSDGTVVRDGGTVVGCADRIAAPLRSEDRRWSVTAVDGGARHTVTMAWFVDEWSLILLATMADRARVASSMVEVTRRRRWDWIIGAVTGKKGTSSMEEPGITGGNGGGIPVRLEPVVLTKRQ
ncbi:hypothetical protein U1Q18_001548 [Sarracenia purpurea var. burkii]